MSKTRDIDFAAMPTPVSLTVTTTLSCSRRAVTVIRPPGSVYLAALLSRFEKTCARRTGSASRPSGSAGSATSSVWFAASISGRLVSTAAAITSARSTLTLRKSILPRVMRETSIRSSISRTMWSTCRSMTS